MAVAIPLWQGRAIHRVLELRGSGLSVLATAPTLITVNLINFIGLQVPYVSSETFGLDNCLYLILI